MASDAGEFVEGMEPRVKTLPMNSQRLTAAVIGRIAKELEVSGLATLEDMRQFLRGRLEEMEHPPQNVRIGLSETERGLVIVLRDDKGTFPGVPTRSRGWRRE